MLPKHIATITYPNWLTDHVPRFITHVKRTNPDATIHVVVIYPPDGSWTGANRTALHEVEKSCRIVRHDMEQPYNSDELRNYLYPDLLRASLPELCGVQRLLYMDPDVDVVGSVDELFDNDHSTPVMLCRSPITDPGTWQSINPNGLFGPGAQYYNIGTILLNDRPGLTAIKTFLNTQLDTRFLPNWCPGSAAWNIAVNRHGPETIQELPYTYGTLPHFSTPAQLREAKVIHFSGPQMKNLRPLFDYSEFPNAIRLNLNPKETT